MTEPPQPASAGRPVRNALAGTCPQCGDGRLFDGPLKFAAACTACGLGYRDFNVGDGPAAFLILIVGAIVTIAAISLELSAQPSPWVHLIWLPVTGVLTVAGLRFGKAWLLAQEYRHRAREGRIAQ